MKKNGFTLVELIAIIIIITAIGLVSFSAMTTTIKKMQIRQTEVFNDNLLNAASLYSETNEQITNLLINGGTYKIDTNILIEAGYLKSDIDNPTTCELTNNFLLATRTEDGDIEYKIYCSTDKTAYTAYATGTTVYFNPITGSICNNYVEENSINGYKGETVGNQNGCMKWYVFNDNTKDSMVNMILDHNTTLYVAWNSTGENKDGPVQLLSQLQTDTTTWITTVDSKYNITHDSISSTGVKSTYTFNYTGYKARLIMANEIAQITKNSSFNSANAGENDYFAFGTNTNLTEYSSEDWYSTFEFPESIRNKQNKYAWLFNNTLNCKSSGCNVENQDGDYSTGYWTGSAFPSDSTRAWRVTFEGLLRYGDVNYDSGFGVRPVVAIQKSKLW